MDVTGLRGGMSMVGGKQMFLWKSLTISDYNVPLKSGRVEAGGNTEDLQTLEQVRNTESNALGNSSGSPWWHILQWKENEAERIVRSWSNNSPHISGPERGW